ncbi:MAG: RpiB/LacA/LacB family sugar-phosphate isomerase [Candidatus Paceibacterota bacterium]|jgi:ribose 5-phosphate isomerase B
MRILFASDHAGYELKEKLVSFVEHELGFEVVDKGAFSCNQDDDYPDIIKLVAEEVSHNPDESMGIVLGGSGTGEAIVANRFPNVRSALYYGGPLEIVSLSREHNNANVLSLGARFLNADEAKAAVKIWLETAFSQEERHVRRIEKIENVMINKLTPRA